MDKKYTLLIVDDTKENIDVLGNLLREEYYVKFALSGKMALKIAEKFEPDLILLDIMMPEMDGYETCTKLKSNVKTSEIPVIFVTAKSEITDEQKGFEVGAVDYITKPIRPLIVKSRVKTHLARYDQKKALSSLVDEKVKELKEINYKIINILGRASEFKDNETGEHIKRIGAYSYILAKALGLSEQQAQLIRDASPMHDVGKIGIPDSILQKPGKLNEKEWQEIRKHPKIGYDILGEHNSTLMKIAAKIAFEHHEKWDGSGYPRGLKGIEISLEGRIISIVDVFDALTSKRPYKEPWPLEKAFRLIEEESGKHFDPNVAEAFLKSKSKIMAVKEKIMEENDYVN